MLSPLAQYTSTIQRKHLRLSLSTGYKKIEQHHIKELNTVLNTIQYNLENRITFFFWGVDWLCKKFL